MQPNRIASDLRALRLSGMADALEQQLAGATWRDVSFEERLEHLITFENELRGKRKVSRILKAANLRNEAHPADFDYSSGRGIDKAVIQSLFRCDWIRDGHLNLLVTGLTGTGKTWTSSAFGYAAALLELTVGYYRVGPLLESLELARHDGLRVKKQDQLRRLDLLILDDLGLETLSHNALIDLLNILEDRVGRKSTIVAAQMPVSSWHEYLGGDATADAIMDRLVHSSEKIELQGKSMRARRRN